MTDDLIARLKAAHNLASAEPWAIQQRRGDVAEYVLTQEPRASGLPEYELGVIGGYFDGPDPVDGYPDADLIVLLRNALPEIIAALEERERLMKWLTYIRDTVGNGIAQDDKRCFGDAYFAANAALRGDALDALEEKE